MAGRKDRDQQSNTTGDRAQSAMGGGGSTRTGVGAGTQAMSGDAATITRGQPAPSGPNIKTTEGKQAPFSPDRGVTLDSKGDVTRIGGGTTVSPNYTPGAVENRPYANPAAVADLLSNAIPGVGLSNSTYKAAKLLSGDDTTFGPLGDMLGADEGPQQGWQPDRTRGMNGGPQNDERDIPGRSYGSNVARMVGDLQTDPVTGETTDYRDDVMLADRRRPYDDLTPEQKRQQLLA